MTTLNAAQLLLDATNPRVMPVEMPEPVAGIRSDPLAELVKELQSGYPAKLTAPQRMGLVIMRYREALAAAREGDAASIRDLPAIARAYIDAARAYDAGSWQAVATSVQGDLQSLPPVSKARTEPGAIMSRTGLIAAHKHHWTNIDADLKGASTNGLAIAAKAGKRNWFENAALAWARSKGRLTDDDKPVARIDAAMHAMSHLPSRKHHLRG